MGMHHPTSQGDQYYYNNLSEALDRYCLYDNILSGDSEIPEVL